ncbi:MAG TPA: nuclear transport factor 2 family protein [Blastocatellia bacterium]|nr:nuclear transport factor 2 family protein [Blastocatellia bacterium]
MKQILTLAFVIIVMPLIIAQVKNMEEKPDQMAVRELRELGNRWLDAIVRRNRAALGDLLDNEVIVTNSDGKVLSKAEEIDDKTTLAYHFAYNNTVDVVRVYQETAVMTGTFTRRLVNREIRGSIGQSSQRYTFVWIKRGARWKIVAAQYTAVMER